MMRRAGFRQRSAKRESCDCVDGGMDEEALRAPSERCCLRLEAQERQHLCAHACQLGLVSATGINRLIYVC